MSVPGESDLHSESIDSRVDRVESSFYDALVSEFDGIKAQPDLTEAEKYSQITELANRIEGFMSRAELVLKEFVSLDAVKIKTLEEEDPEVIHVDFGRSDEPEPEQTLVVQEKPNGVLEINGSLLGLNARESELFALLPYLGPRFIRSDVLSRDFHLKGTYDARTQSFPKVAKSLAEKINNAANESVLVQRGVKNKSHYVVLKTLVINGALIEAYVEPEPRQELPQVKERPTRRLPTSRRHPLRERRPRRTEDPPAPPVDPDEGNPPVDLDEDSSGLHQGSDDELRGGFSEDGAVPLGEDIDPEAVIVRAARRIPGLRPAVPKKEQVVDQARAEVRSVFDDYLSPDELLPLEEALRLARQPKHARPVTEVKDDRGVIMAIWGILDSGKATDYRARAILPIRYGIYPDKFKGSFPRIRRDNQPIDLDDIMRAIPPAQGVTEEAASQLLGLKPEVILETELTFVKKMSRTDDFKALAPLVKKLEAQLLKQKITASK